MGVRSNEQVPQSATPTTNSTSLAQAHQAAKFTTIQLEICCEMVRPPLGWTRLGLDCPRRALKAKTTGLLGKGSKGAGSTRVIPAGTSQTLWERPMRPPLQVPAHSLVGVLTPLSTPTRGALCCPKGGDSRATDTASAKSSETALVGSSRLYVA